MFNEKADYTRHEMISTGDRRVIPRSYIFRSQGGITRKTSGTAVQFNKNFR
jgi:hypothetical protein